MKNSKQTLLMVLLLGLIGLQSIGCGPTRSIAPEHGSTEEASRIPGGEDFSDKPLARCNGQSGDLFSSQLKAYQDHTGAFYNEFIRARLSGVTEEFKNDRRLYFNFYRWQARPDGSVHIDPTPIEFRFEDRNSGFPVGGYQQALNWDSADDILRANGYNVQGVRDIFDRVNFVMDIRDPRADYDALMLLLFRDGEVIERHDVLLPVFHANPADYAIEGSGAERPLVLRNLHPLGLEASTSWRFEDYDSAFNNFCF